MRKENSVNVDFPADSAEAVRTCVQSMVQETANQCLTSQVRVVKQLLWMPNLIPVTMQLTANEVLRRGCVMNTPTQMDVWIQSMDVRYILRHSVCQCIPRSSCFHTGSWAEQLWRRPFTASHILGLIPRNWDLMYSWRRGGVVLQIIGYCSIVSDCERKWREAV